MHAAAIVSQSLPLISPEGSASQAGRKKKTKKSDTGSPKKKVKTIVIEDGTKRKTKTPKKKKKKKKPAQSAEPVSPSTASVVSEDTTLSGRFDSCSLLLSSPLANNLKLSTKVKSPKKTKQRQRLETHQESLDERDGQARWVSSKHKAEESSTPRNPGIEIDDAIQVGFAVLRALKSDDQDLAVAPKSVTRRKGKKEEILNHLHNIMDDNGLPTEPDTPVDALDTVQEILTDKTRKLQRSQSAKSLDTAPSVPHRTNSNESLGDLAQNLLRKVPSIPNEESAGDISIPSLVDIESPGQHRKFVAQDRNDAYPAVNTLSPKRQSLYDTSRKTSHSATDKRKKSPKEGRRSQSRERKASIAGSSHRSQSTSPGSHRRRSSSSKHSNHKNLLSADEHLLSRSSRSLTSEMASTRRASDRSQSKERRKVTMATGIDVASTVQQPRSPSKREYRKPQSERMLRVDDRSVSLLTDKTRSMTRREYRKANSERLLNVEDRSVSRSNRSPVEDEKTRSMTRREFRRAQSERNLSDTDASLSNQSLPAKLSQHLIASERRGRRPRSERSLGAASVRSSKSHWMEPGRKSIAEDSVADPNSLDDVSRRRVRRPDRAPHQRSMSVDGSQMRVSGSPRKTRPAAGPNMTSISSNQWGSLRNLSVATEPTASLAKGQLGSLRNLTQSGSIRNLTHSTGGSRRSLTSSGGSMRNLFRRKDKYVDFESKESIHFVGSTEQSLKLPRAQSMVIESGHTTETLQHIEPVGPLPPPPPISSPVTPKLRPPKKDSKPYSNPGRVDGHPRSRSKSPGMPPPRPVKSLSMSHIDYVISSPSCPRPISGDAAVACMAWEPSSAPASKSPFKRRAKKGEKLKRLLHLNAKMKAPLAEQETEEEEDEILIPLHFLDAKEKRTY